MISAVVLTRNEEKNIVDCLEDLSFCDEIIVVDDNSSDRTVEIAKRMSARVLIHGLDNDFSKQRNFALENVRNGWVLFVDADERVSRVLAKEIEYVTTEDKKDGFFIKRYDTIWGKTLRHGELSDLKLLRLGKVNKGRWEGNVHEKWLVNGRTSTLKNFLNHYPHQTIEAFLREINYYTDLKAKELHKNGVIVKWYSIFLYPKGKFLLNYFIKLGFLDGVEGFIFAVLMSFHSFLVRGKLWILNQKNLS